MKRAVVLFSLLTSAAIESAAADQSPEAASALLNELRAACQTDAQNLCAGVQAGGGRIVSCLAQHKDAVSDACKQALMKARQAQGQGPAATQTPTPTAAPAPAPAPAPASTSSQSQNPGHSKGQAPV